MPLTSQSPAAAPTASGSAPAFQASQLRGWQLADAQRVGNVSADLNSRKNTLATVGLVFAIISLVGVPFAWLVGLILSGIGLSRSNAYSRAGYSPIGHAKSIWGLVLSSLGTLVATVLLVSFLGNNDSFKAGYNSGRGGTAGTVLAVEVTRAITQTGSTATDVTCEDTPKRGAGVITDCKATIDGTPVGIRVTWNDAEHFTATRQPL